MPIPIQSLASFKAILEGWWGCLREDGAHSISADLCVRAAASDRSGRPEGGPAMPEPARLPGNAPSAPRAPRPRRRRGRREVRGAIFKSLGPAAATAGWAVAGVPVCQGEPGRAGHRAVRGEPGYDGGWAGRGPSACLGPQLLAGGRGGPLACARPRAFPSAPPLVAAQPGREGPAPLCARCCSPGNGCRGLCGLQGQEGPARCKLSSVYTTALLSTSHPQPRSLGGKFLFFYASGCVSAVLVLFLLPSSYV